MTEERFDPAGWSSLTDVSCTALVRAALDPSVSPPPVPGLLDGEGALTDAATAVAATWAAPLLHVTLDTHDRGTVRSGHVHWAPSATVVSRLHDADGPGREVRYDDARAFARVVVEAAGIADAPAAEQPREVTTGELARSSLAGGVPLRLVTSTLVAPERGTDDLSAPGPRPGTEPVSRALAVAADGLRRVEHRSGDRLVLVPWSGADEQAWFGQVLAGFRDRLAADPDR